MESMEYTFWKDFQNGFMWSDKETRWPNWM